MTTLPAPATAWPALLTLVLLGAGPAQADPDAGFGGWPNRGRLGIEVQSMTDALREYFGAPEDRGVLVVRVEEARPGAAAGVQVGDVFTAAAGEPVERPFDLIASVARVPAGERLELEVVRKGAVLTIGLAPDGDPVPLPRAKDWHDLRDRMTEGLHEGTSEILRRLDEIERRLERMEQQRSAPPLEERT